MSAPVKHHAALAARLAEVEAERDGVSMQNDLAGEQLREMAAERDRLAQELEGALGHLRDVAKRARSLRDVEAERDEARRRLAEVEGKLETAEGEAYYWRSLCSEDDRVEQLQRRLAEVEAENAELVEKLKAGLSRNDRTSLSSLFGYDLGVEEGRAEGRAERDRLAQRGVELLEKVQLFAATGQRVTQERDEALGHLRAVMNAERQAPPHRPQEDDEALAFLARFPREGDEG